jgi:phenylpropionate dioxygenase-like ring-hydroxylating dioxygenase large terminal subunit
VEDGRLRCIYHGWLYDIHGHCLDQPGEPGGGERKGEIRHPAYPCEEKADVIFTYLGPGDPPLVPDYEFLTAPKENRFVSKFFFECNYLQGVEGAIDPAHLSFLHRNFQDTQFDRQYKAVQGSGATRNTIYGKDSAPRIEVDLTDIGLRIYSIRKAGPEKSYLRVSNFVYPCLAAFPGPTSGEGYSVNWHVPVDDTHHFLYGFVYNGTKPIKQELVSHELEEVGPDYRLKHNLGNRYLQDREAMRTQNYTGTGMNFRVHDALATESQGTIQDRTREHPVSGDKVILAARKLLLQAMRDLREGREAPHILRDSGRNRVPELVVISGAIPAEADWRDYTKQAEGAAVYA